MYVTFHLILQNQLHDFKLTATTEYPKWDVHEWRKQRDIKLYGRIAQLLLENVKATPIKTNRFSRQKTLRVISYVTDSTNIN